MEKENKIESEKIKLYLDELFYYSMFQVKKINDIDLKIIYILSSEKKTIGELAKTIDIAPINLWKHLKKLEGIGVVKVPDVKKGKKKYPYLTELNNDMIKRLVRLSGAADFWIRNEKRIKEIMVKEFE